MTTGNVISPKPQISLAGIDRRGLAAALGTQVDRKVNDVLADFGLGPPGTDPRTDKILSDPSFASEVRRIHYEWRRDEARLRAAVAVCGAVPSLGRIASDPEVSPGDRVSSVNALTKIAGLDRDPPSSGTGVTITLNLPGMNQPIAVMGNVTAAPGPASSGSDEAG